jgi:hypothetical protein
VRGRRSMPNRLTAFIRRAEGKMKGARHTSAMRLDDDLKAEENINTFYKWGIWGAITLKGVSSEVR